VSSRASWLRLRDPLHSCRGTPPQAIEMPAMRGKEKSGSPRPSAPGLSPQQPPADHFRFASVETKSGSPAGGSIAGRRGCRFVNAAVSGGSHEAPELLKRGSVFETAGTRSNQKRSSTTGCCAASLAPRDPDGARLGPVCWASLPRCPGRRADGWHWSAPGFEDT
jgi:hypothetical protein